MAEDYGGQVSCIDDKYLRLPEIWKLVAIAEMVSRCRSALPE